MVKAYQALLRLFQLNAVVQIQRDAADWLGLLTASLFDSLTDYTHYLLDAIRPNAVGLVDSLGYDDEVLQSTIGQYMYDGNVYEAIYEEAKKSPLNQFPKMVGWKEIAPALDLDFIKAGIGQRASKL